MDKQNFDSSFGPLVEKMLRRESHLRFFAWALLVLAMGILGVSLYQRGYADAVTARESDIDNVKRAFNACVEIIRKK